MTRRVRPIPVAATVFALVTGLLASLSGLVAPALAASEFPAGYEGFHTYAEMSAEVAAVAAAHPDIVQRFSIGQSYQGRQLWAAKISDNVATDEAEPEVLFDGLHHSDEHMGLEMTLRILHWLVDGYGTDPRITGIVNRREIWIVFAANPDGAQYDIRNGRFHHWRKNRSKTRTARWARISTATTAIAGAAAARPAETRSRSRIAARPRLRRGDPCLPRLPGQPRRGRAPADPRGDHVPRVRPPRDVAVRLHEEERSRGHDDPGPRRARRDRQAHGRQQRLPAGTGERPVHHLGHDA